MQRAISLIILILLMLSIAVWFMTREPLPRTITIASGVNGGLYHQFATTYKPVLEMKSGRKVVLRETKGSLENQQLLQDGQVDLAIFQVGSAPEQELAILAPLFQEVIHVMVRDGRKIRKITDLTEKSVAIGPLGSGMQISAIDLLDHYRVNTQPMRSVHFTQMETDLSLDAAIVTSGISNQALKRMLNSGEYRLLDVEGADAMVTWKPWYQKYAIPLGLYLGQPPVPHKSLDTIETTAVLVARSDAFSSLVDVSLSALYDHRVVNSQPQLITESEAAKWNVLPKHVAARAYFTPYEGLEHLSHFLESLAAVKELLIALFAGLYLLWDRWRHYKSAQTTAHVEEQKRQLKRMLEETIRIERAQINISDIEVLRNSLDEITKIKLRALEQLTHDDLRDDALFSIFITQCANVINKIQGKIRLLQGPTRN